MGSAGLIRQEFIPFLVAVHDYWHIQRLRKDQDTQKNHRRCCGFLVKTMTGQWRYFVPAIALSTALILGSETRYSRSTYICPQAITGAQFTVLLQSLATLLDYGIFTLGSQLLEGLDMSSASGRPMAPVIVASILTVSPLHRVLKSSCSLHTRVLRLY